jgi:hypothetical protein
MSDINSLITSHNIQSELIKNEIEQNNLMVEAVKEQKYNELLKENNQLKDRINKTIEYIEEHLKESEVKIYGIPKCKIFMGSVEELLDLLKGDKE